MTTGKTIALTIQTFVSKVMSLLFNALTMFVIAFLSRSRCLLTSWLQSLLPLFPLLFAMKWWDQIPWSKFVECWVLSQFFRFLLSLSLRGSLVPLHFLPLEWYIFEVVHLSSGNLDSNLWLIQPIISHDVLCIKVKWARWHYTVLFSILNFEPVSCSMSGSNCCFFTCIQVSQETGKVVWYSPLFKNFLACDPHSQRFSIVNEEEGSIFLEFPWFLHYATNIGNLMSGSSVSFKPSFYIWNFWLHILLKPR